MNVKNIWDYIKCAVANRLTLGGYIAGGLGGTLAASDNFAYGLAPLVAANLLIVVSGAALPTLDKYQRTKAHIAQHGTIESRFGDAIPKYYCDQMGYYLAAKEANLEHLVKKHPHKFL